MIRGYVHSVHCTLCTLQTMYVLHFVHCRLCTSYAVYIVTCTIEFCKALFCFEIPMIGSVPLKLKFGNDL